MPRFLVAISGEATIERLRRVDRFPASRDIPTDRLDISILAAIGRWGAFALLSMRVKHDAVVGRNLARSIGKSLRGVLVQQDCCVSHSACCFGSRFVSFQFDTFGNINYEGSQERAPSRSGNLDVSAGPNAYRNSLDHQATRCGARQVDTSDPESVETSLKNLESSKLVSDIFLLLWIHRILESPLQAGATPLQNTTVASGA